jgi:predicted Zn-dependent peptidase
VILGYPSGFETPGAVAHQLETLVEFDLSDDYFNTVIPSIAKVTAEDVARVGREYLDVDHLAIIIVGDRSQIEASLRKLPEGKNLNACRLDEEFRLVGE